MNVLIVSQCDHRALVESRRIIDQFAERRGDRTWQTPITQEGLNTLRRLLRKSARKNTAVACHWVRGLDHTELLWIVGNTRRFNDAGAVPIKESTRNVRRAAEEHDWYSHEDIILLSALAALLHDIGKSTDAFQSVLRSAQRQRNQYRHEWVSARMFAAFVGSDTDEQWVRRLAAPGQDDDESWLGRLRRDGVDDNCPPLFVELQHAPLAQAVVWLILTHHRLPIRPPESDQNERFLNAAEMKDILLQIGNSWNEIPTESERKIVEPYWQFSDALPVTHPQWRREATRICNRLLALLDRPDRSDPCRWIANPYVMHISRLCLMLADHHYSGLNDRKSRVQLNPQSALYANTLKGALHQPLDEHLIGVFENCQFITHSVPRFEEWLPRLRKNRAFRKRAQTEEFRWQDRAVDVVGSLRGKSAENGAFIVNMASTGSGKTLANAKIMYALADPIQGMRCAFAMGLRVLTLQTGRAFQELLKLGDDEIAIRVGGSGSRELFEYYERQAEEDGATSRQAIFDEDGVIEYSNDSQAHPMLRRAIKDTNVRALLAAPILVCTIDHLMPATESQRGGRQIGPMLRLMSGDLVLDEPDDFDIDDLPAMTRLVHWAGLLGSRVLLSSATLPPALVRGLFAAYCSGRAHFEANRRLSDTKPKPLRVCCAWIDEHEVIYHDCSSLHELGEKHDAFARRRVDRLAELAHRDARRRAELIPLPAKSIRTDGQVAPEFARHILDCATELHARHHMVDAPSGKRVSFGLIRMANIEPLYQTALEMLNSGAPPLTQIHLCVYHSQFPLLVRSEIEHRLDRTLHRSDPEAVLRLPDIRVQLEYSSAPNHLFIVLGSPVTEVGRDHDYDWAIVEPSSMRSLIQLAGRVRRHRPGGCAVPNIRILRTNLRSMRSPGEPAFCRPGFENQDFKLEHHDLERILRQSEYETLDSRPRILLQDPSEFRPRSRLTDLEHERIQAMMLHRETERHRGRPGSVTVTEANAALWWSLPASDALLTGVLQESQQFRKPIVPTDDLVLRMSTNSGDEFELVRLLPRRGSHNAEQEVIERSLLTRIDLPASPDNRIRMWEISSYANLLYDLAAELSMDMEYCSMRYGTVSLPKSAQGWRYHPALGFGRNR